VLGRGAVSGCCMEVLWMHKAATMHHHTSGLHKQPELPSVCGVWLGEPVAHPGLGQQVLRVGTVGLQLGA